MKKLTIKQLKKFIDNLPDDTCIGIDNGYGDDDVYVWSAYVIEDESGKSELVLSI